MCIPLAHHKVSIKCARCRLCRLGAHPSCLWLLWVVCGPAHGPLADVEELAASAWLPVLVAVSQWKEVPLAAAQRSRNSAVVPSWNERQPFQDGGDWHNVDDGLLLLIQLLRPALASLPPPGGDSPVHQRNKDQWMCTSNAHTMQTQCRLTAFQKVVVQKVWNAVSLGPSQFGPKSTSALDVPWRRPRRYQLTRNSQSLCPGL